MKLIKYPGKEAWSELFDLAKDPYETRNLYSDQAYADKRTELERRYQERAKQIGYHVPEYADEKRLKPQDLLPEDPTIKPANAWVLDYSFDGNLNATVSDQSDFKNDGKVVGKLQSADGPQGTVARFDGKSYIEVPMSKVLNPARSPMTIEVTLRASADGVVVARGGQNLGFLIEIENGKPVFAYRGPEGFWRAVGSDPILDKWVTLKATLGKDQQMKVAVDGQQVGQAQAKGFIPRNPNDGLQIGSDSGSPVDKKSPEGFRGEIQRVRIYHGSL
jgi:hypothetical protein